MAPLFCAPRITWILKKGILYKTLLNSRRGPEPRAGDLLYNGLLISRGVDRFLLRLNLSAGGLLMICKGSDPYERFKARLRHPRKL